MSDMESSHRSLGRKLIWAKAFYFCFFAAAAALFPFLVLHYESLGLSGSQIGILVSIPPLISPVGAPLWAGIADATQRHKTILIVAMIGTICLILVLSQATIFILMIPVIVLYAFFFAPIIPLSDNAVMDLLVGQKDDYGHQRVWGSVGWGLSAPLIGQLIETSGLEWSFWGFTAFMLLGLLIVQQIPFHEFRASAPFWQGARILLANHAWLLFLFLVFVGGIGQSVIANYLFLFMDDLGASKAVMGLALTVATISEIPLFLIAGRMLERWSARGLFMIGTLIYVVRMLALSYIHVPWLVLVTQLTQGFTFPLMWVAGVSYANRIAPPGLTATAQGLFFAVLMGIATAAGAILGGALYQRFGSAMMYRIVAIGVFCSILIYLWVERRYKMRNSAPATAI